MSDFWKRPASFGFELPDYGRPSEDDYFPGTRCVKLSGTRLMKDLISQCREMSRSRYASGPKPRLAVVLCGEDPASAIYVSHKQKRFADCGFESELHRLSSSETSAESLGRLIDELNAREDVHGILLQLPLPGSLDARPFLDRIDPKKDVDGFHIINNGCLATGRYEGFLPCTPFGIFVLLGAHGIDISGQNVVVVGRSNIVGKPAALMALNARATVTVVHKATRDIRPFTQAADVLIVGAGSHQLIAKEHVSEGVVVVDVGIHTTPEGKVEGDVQPSVRERARMATPVPGGVGPVTIAMLCVNTAMACWESRA